MCLVAVPVLLEYLVNAPIAFTLDFINLWKMDSHV
jgi:hypothetical protein